MFEVEIKAKVDNFDAIRENLKKIGAIKKKELKMGDIYFKHPSRDFAKTDEALRIRNSNKNNFLTYKGPKLDELTKTRKEIEIEINEPRKLKNILLNLGFIQVPKIKKKRVIYEINQFQICLDDVDFIGKFVEIETEVKDEIDRELKTNEIINFAQELGISKENFIRKSYLELIKEKVKNYI